MQIIKVKVWKPPAVWQGAAFLKQAFIGKAQVAVVRAQDQMIQYDNVQQLPRLPHLVGQNPVRVAWFKITTGVVMRQDQRGWERFQSHGENHPHVGHGTGNTAFTELVSAFNLVRIIEVKDPKALTHVQVIVPNFAEHLVAITATGNFLWVHQVLAGVTEVYFFNCVHNKAVLNDGQLIAAARAGKTKRKLE